MVEVGSGDAGSLLVVTGPPGAGKSTVAALLADRHQPGALIEGDAFYRFLAGGAIEPWRPESAAQNGVVTDATAAATAAFVGGGYRTVYDGILGPWFIDRFLAGAGIATIDYAILLPPVERCVRRVATRTGHGFTDEAATRKMHHEFTSATVDARHLFDNDGEAPGSTAERIAARAATGELSYTGSGSG